MQQSVFKHKGIFKLESGAHLSDIEIAYCAYGKLNAEKNNVVWVCHALTANADCTDWWSGVVGANKIIDTEKYFVVCANILGSCYGSTSPKNINPESNEKYGKRFPLITIRDMVNAHIALRKNLGIEEIKICMGGSMGGYQAMEWALMEKNVIEKLILLCTSARESAWGIAIHTAQRLAIEADESFYTNTENAGAKGLKAARAIGMLTYRNYAAFAQTQTDDDDTKLDNYKAASYIHHQGDKLVSRFNAHSYHVLTKAMDSHNIARNRGSIENVLSTVKNKTLLIGISTDFLCPNAEQVFMAKHLPNAELKIIESGYGHDGFLIEWLKITEAISDFLEN